MYLCICTFVFLVSSCAAVQRDFFMFSNAMEDAEEAEVITSSPDEQTGLAAFYTLPSLSTRQCCKVGERIGRRRLPCDLDDYITMRAANMILKSKNVRLTTSNNTPSTWNRVPTYRELGRCYQHRKVFEKCCVHRVSLPHYWIHWLY